MDEILQASFEDNVRNNAVERVHVIQNQDGKFQIVVKVKWKQRECLITTTRGTPRAWASLDRLVSYFLTFGAVIPRPISLTLTDALDNSNEHNNELDESG